ncbi:MAG: MFS transporter [Microvirga sp.]
MSSITKSPPTAPAGLGPVRAKPAPNRARHNFGFWAAALAFVIVQAYNTIPAPLYGIYKQRDGFSSFMVTIIFAALAIGVVISLFTIGHISDWHGRRRLFLPAIVLCMISAAVFLLWRSLPGLLVGRLLGGLAVGMVSATATAWIAELHGHARPEASMRRAQVVSTAAILGGLGVGALVSGVLAEWVTSPLTVPYLVSLGALAVAFLAVVAAPETRERVQPRPTWRPQRVSVPQHAVGSFVAACIGAAIAFAVFGLFTSLSSTFLATSLGHPSLALAGATTFAVFSAAVVTQTLIKSQDPRPMMSVGIAVTVVGLAGLVVSVWLNTPSLVMFLAGGVVTGAGVGALWKGVVIMVGELAPPDRRAEALAGLFLAANLGLTVPSIGLGIMTQYLSARLSLLIFAGVLVLGAAAAAPRLLAGPEGSGKPAGRR